MAANPNPAPAPAQVGPVLLPEPRILSVHGVNDCVKMIALFFPRSAAKIKRELEDFQKYPFRIAGEDELAVIQYYINATPRGKRMIIATLTYRYLLELVIAMLKEICVQLTRIGKSALLLVIAGVVLWAVMKHGEVLKEVASMQLPLP